MDIAAVQFRPAFKDVEANVSRIEEWISEINADLIVFPELATSGYFFRSTAEAAPFATHEEHPVLERIIAAAQAAGRVVVCGFAESSGSQLFNSAVICGKGLTTRIYRKSHLFFREVDVFTPGNTGFFVVDLPEIDCRLGVMICYDWRFPEAARTLALRGADVIACPSNLVTGIWRSVIPARAIENKVYLAVANRTGNEFNGGEDVAFNGQSVIYGYNGKPLASAGDTEDRILMAEINPEKTRNKSFNSVNDIFVDRRPELYE